MPATALLSPDDIINVRYAVASRTGERSTIDGTR